MFFNRQVKKPSPPKYPLRHEFPDDAKEKASRSCCYSKLELLQLIVFLAILGHILLLSFAIGTMQTQRSIYFISIESLDTSTAGSDLLTVSITGLLVNILAFVGLWRRSRLYLLPLIVYLITFIMIDLVVLGIYIAFHVKLDHNHDQKTGSEIPSFDLVNIWTGTKITPSTELDNQKIISLTVVYSLLALKIIISSFVLRLGCLVFSRDPKMRVHRSPLRNFMKTSPKDDNNNKKKDEDNDKNDVTPTKPYKYFQFV